VKIYLQRLSNYFTNRQNEVNAYRIGGGKTVPAPSRAAVRAAGGL